jgi:hypothetical protein
VPLLKRNSAPTVTAWPWQFVSPARDRPLEQCSAALRTTTAILWCHCSNVTAIQLLVAWPWQIVRPARDRPLEQCSVALRTAAAILWCHCSNVTAIQPLVAWPWQIVRPARDRPLEQCSVALRTTTAPHTACASGGVLVNVLAARSMSMCDHAHEHAVARFCGVPLRCGPPPHLTLRARVAAC